MNILITAGNTVVPIDRVRCLTNIFTGRTGAAIACCAHERGHDVTLLTSHPEAAAELRGQGASSEAERWRVVTYRTFDDLRQGRAQRTAAGGLDAVIHCAAVSDYRAAGVYAAAPGTRFLAEGLTWDAVADNPHMLDRAAGKVKSGEEELWLRLVRTPKLVDFIRADWGFRGVLVKFKLEVGISDAELLDIAENSRVHSAADLMVANTLEGAAAWAYLGPVTGGYKRVSRRELPQRLLEAVEARHKERSDG